MVDELSKEPFANFELTISEGFRKSFEAKKKVAAKLQRRVVQTELKHKKRVTLPQIWFNELSQLRGSTQRLVLVLKSLGDGGGGKCVDTQKLSEAMTWLGEQEYTLGLKFHLVLVKELGMRHLITNQIVDFLALATADGLLWSCDDNHELWRSILSQDLPHMLGTASQKREL